MTKGMKKWTYEERLKTLESELRTKQLGSQLPGQITFCYFWKSDLETLKQEQ